MAEIYRSSFSFVHSRVGHEREREREREREKERKREREKEREREREREEARKKSQTKKVFLGAPSRKNGKQVYSLVHQYSTSSES